jgi:sulfite reductase alpha subunit-like flavoprotein
MNQDRVKVAGIVTFLAVGILAWVYQNTRTKEVVVDRVPASLNSALKHETQPQSVPTQRKVTILYATTTGTARKFANTLLHHLGKKCDMEIRTVDLKDFSEDHLSKEDIVLLICSTFQDGQSPQSAKLFFDDLNDQAFDFRVSKDLFANVHFSVFGLGGAIYGKNYGKVVRYILNCLIVNSQ